MKDDKPYIDEQWNDLPLPDADKAWQRMELLLDEDKKRRRVLPFWAWGGLGLLLTGMAIGGWFWLQGGSAEDATAQQELSKQVTPSTTTTDKGRSFTGVPDKNEPSTVQDQVTTEKIESDEPEKTERLTNHPVTINPERKNTTASIVAKKKDVRGLKKKASPQGRKAAKETTPSETTPQQTPTKTHTETAVLPGNDQPKEIQKTVLQPKDSLAKKDTAVKAAEPVAATEPQKKKEKKSAFAFSAGIGLQQAIALKNQQSASVNYNGKRSTVSDLIPSVYFRLQKGAWFAQAEFQYAVPQPVEQFSFSQKTTYDVAALNVNVERFNLRKLYYHQLPISINYHIMPNWSVGAGAMYNILAGAVTEQEVQSLNVQTGLEATTRSLAPVSGYNDSFLYKTTAGILVQTDYHWKRFSLGMRFTQNLEPFITYTRPDGTVSDEKNKVLQAILRFRLF